MPSTARADDGPTASPWKRDAPLGEPGPAPRVLLPLPVHQPLWTYVVLVINAVVWLAMTAAGGSQDGLVLVRFGAKFNPLIVAGQYWRLFTACFLHIGPAHLLFNSYALFSFGIDVERHYGRARFLALYLLAGLSGSVVSFLGSEALSAGASGAIFGLVGAIITYFLVHREAFGQRGRRQLMNVLVVAAFNLIWGLATPGIDSLGHIGGFLAGLLLGWAFCPKYEVTYDGPNALASAGQPELVDVTYQRFLGSPRAALCAGVVLLAITLLTMLGVRVHS